MALVHAVHSGHDANGICGTVPQNNVFMLKSSSYSFIRRAGPSSLSYAEHGEGRPFLRPALLWLLSRNVHSDTISSFILPDSAHLGMTSDRKKRVWQYEDTVHHFFLVASDVISPAAESGSRVLAVKRDGCSGSPVHPVHPEGALPVPRDTLLRVFEVV